MNLVPDSERRRAVAGVDYGAIERNCARLTEELTGSASLCVVVKANGYGHGAVESGRAALAGGASVLAVVSGAEARELRAALPDARILVMGALAPLELDEALAAGAEISVWQPGFLKDLISRVGELGKTVPVHVKYDSGMGRFGERDPDAAAAMAAAAAQAPDVELTGLWTHFATADEPDSDFFSEQLERFGALAERLRAEHADLCVHAANSAAMLREPASHFDMVRCGIAVYGLDPFHLDPAEQRLEPALELRSHVAAVKRFEAGASAGYGQRWHAERETLVGVLPIGYADGVRRGLTNNAEVLIGGRRRPLVGTVSMDSITVDLGPQSKVEVGDEAVLIGAQGKDRILCEEVAGRLETINYEITCGISARVPRLAETR